jgi:hypothetical protein
MKLKNLLSFERMITPVIIKVLFWIGLIGSVVGGIVLFFTVLIGGISDGSFGGIVGSFLLGLVGGLLVMFLGILLTRIYAEMLILVFQINESLTDIKYLIEKREDI